jgi:HSP20 family protein
MNIVKWEPFREMVGFRQAVDRLFEDAFIRPSRFLSWEDGLVPLDVYQTPEAVVVEAALPGVKPGEVDISITGDTLTIKRETKAEHEVKKEDYFLQERRYGRFSRAVTLPDGLLADKAEASFEESILTVTIPKAEEVKPRTIKVKAKEAAEGKAEKK